MSILKRMRDITLANLNERLESAEDPVRMLDHFLSVQREQLREAERLHQQCAAHGSYLRQQYLNALETKEKRENQAMLALKAGEEHIARVVLQEKIQAEERCEQFRELYEQAKESIIELEQQINELRAEYEEASSRRSYYIARMESARLQQRMNARMSHMGSDGIPRMFNRIDERVTDMEIEARSLRDLRRTTQGGAYSSHPALEEELENLRKKLKEGE
ncbi:PspA/IM30 family protein [Paenibacillus albiflavus]|uniref:PspA/IM30 family protein n=1 Tax=Paenibacillus albiflavus TaxID=2545760 RepID=A0A4R4EHG0_9BACL|nr:PspA/IM30 family protein [Paenibacillus albiflavus]TCZ77721.1 PspA/IM30 family protein [Paenibacillus albiflavus]